MSETIGSAGAVTAALPPAEWNRRWSVVKGSLFFTAAVVLTGLGWAIYSGKENLIETLAVSLLVYAGGLVGAYCGFATWDDKNYRESLVNLRNGAKK
jgi:hypothetical protein